MKKLVIVLFTCIVVSACNISSSQPQASEAASPTSNASEETKQVTAIPDTVTVEATQTPSETSDCSNPSLTPEEVANCGQHTYSIEANQVAGDCYYKLDDGSRVQSFSKVETYTITFDSGTMRTIGEDSESISTKIAPNTYEFKDEDTITLTTFTLDGWVDEFTWGDCKDVEVATIIK